MASHKRSALKRQRDVFEQGIGGLGDVFEQGVAGLGDASEQGIGGLGDVFAQEERRQRKAKVERDVAMRNKACTSKNRYTTRAEAEGAIADCAAHGTTGLRCYRCAYCNGWHLTSHAY